MGVCLSKPNNEFSDLSAIKIDLKVIPIKPIEQNEHELIKICMKVLDHANFNLYRLGNYKGSSEKIRMAIMTPDSDIESHTWEAIRPIVHILKDCYLTSLMLEDLFPVLLYKLSQPSLKEGMRIHHSLLRIITDILFYIYSFDSCKMGNPEIQNDFSYYRRTMNRKKLYGCGSWQDAIVPEDVANRMSMFFAGPNPLQTSIAKKLKYECKKPSITPKLRSSIGGYTKSICFTSDIHGKVHSQQQGSANDMDLEELCINIEIQKVIANTNNYRDENAAKNSLSNQEPFAISHTMPSTGVKSLVMFEDSQDSLSGIYDKLDTDRKVSFAQKAVKPVDLHKEKHLDMIEYFSNRRVSLEDGDTLTNVLRTVATYLKKLYRKKSDPPSPTSDISFRALSVVGFICLSQTKDLQESSVCSNHSCDIDKLLSISTLCTLICDRIYSDDDHKLSHDKSFPIHIKTLLVTIRETLPPEKGNSLLSLIKYSSLSYREDTASSATLKLLKEYQ